MERGDVRGKAVHTTKSTPPNISTISSKKDKLAYPLSFHVGWNKGQCPLQTTPCLFEIMFKSGSGAGVIVESLFRCPGYPESSKLISCGMASLGNPTELEM